jgi:PcfJ-like protein
VRRTSASSIWCASRSRYRVAAHLENAWIDEFTDDFVNRVAMLPEPSRARPNRTMLRWYLVAAQGGSLYKQHASAHLTKLETHHFLAAPDEVTTSQQALWYAVARAHSGHSDVARQVARSRLVDYSIASPWWREIARFFAQEIANQALAQHEMQDLIDFLRVAKLEDHGFSLKGRSLASLKRRMEEWHRALRKSNTIGGGAWAGAPIADIAYEVGNDDKKAIWRFRQIKTGNALFEEGQRMHHCVASYKGLCLNGEVSIWSLTAEFPLGHVNRGVTIELRKDGTIVQVRGFANRRPHGNETTMVRRWAQEHRLRWNGW